MASQAGSIRLLFAAARISRMTAVIDNQSEVIDFLSKSSAYGLEPRAVDRCETHGAIVFLVGDRAYKLKRAVRLPYMDYSSVERRHAMCQAEIFNKPLVGPGNLYWRAPHRPERGWNAPHWFGP